MRGRHLGRDVSVDSAPMVRAVLASLCSPSLPLKSPLDEGADASKNPSRNRSAISNLTFPFKIPVICRCRLGFPQVCTRRFCGSAKHFDGLKHAQVCFLQIGKCFALGSFMFDRPEESFHHGIVVATSGTAHRTLDHSIPSDRSIPR
jgi:hypothetical protein